MILHIKNGMYYGLDEVGVVIWRELQKGTTVAALIANIVEQFDVSREQCEQDVLRIIHEMVAAQLVVLEGS